MRKTVKLSENDIHKIVNKVINEQKNSRYMFFSNLEQMKRQCEMLLELDENMLESILEDGHDWAQDHIAEAKNNMDQVFDFIMNETKRDYDIGNKIVTESKLDFIIGKDISLIKRLHTTRYNPESGTLEKVKKDEEIYGEITNIKSDDSYSVPVLIVKYPKGTAHIMFDKSKNRFIEGDSTFLYEYLPISPKDERILNLFKINFYEENDKDLMEEGVEITEKKKKNTPTNPKLWQQSLAWAKSRYKVCPSAYCNGAAVKRYNSKGGKWKKK